MKIASTSRARVPTRLRHLLGTTLAAVAWLPALAAAGADAPAWYDPDPSDAHAWTLRAPLVASETQGRACKGDSDLAMAGGLLTRRQAAPARRGPCGTQERPLS